MYGALKHILRRNMSAHQRIMLKTMLTHIDFLNEQILELDTSTLFNKILNGWIPFQELARRTVEQILAEVGTDVGSRFPSAAHLCSWVGLVPGHNESAGKRKSSKTRKGNKYLRSALIEVAHSV